MLQAYKRGIKLTIALHDRWSLGNKIVRITFLIKGCWRYDVYVDAFNITRANCANQTYNNPFPFYSNPKAIQAFQNRVAHILNHVNPHFGLPWSSLSDVIFSVEPENEPMFNEGLFLDSCSSLKLQYLSLQTGYAKFPRSSSQSLLIYLQQLEEQVLQ